jgi:DNA polymerase
MSVHLDGETGSPVELTTSGLYVYFEDPNTRVWLFRYKWLDGQYYEWRPGWPDPVALLEYVANGGKIIAHNAAFERRMWKFIRQTYCPHWPPLTIKQQDCTMARASAMTLPARLEKLGEVLNLPVQKDMAGAALMKKMAKPRKRHPDGSYEWWDTPENLEVLSGYCATDVMTEDCADVALPPLSDLERAIWELDQRINDRGVMIDVATVVKAAEMVEVAKKRADQRMCALTGGAVKKVTEVKKLVAWLNGRGIETTSVKKEDYDDLIATCGALKDDAAKEAIELRRAGAKTSTGKYKKMVGCVCEDDRIRGLLAYSATSTKRWAGRLVQPQNFPRMDEEREGESVAFFIKALSLPMPVADVCDLTALCIGEPMLWLSKSLRQMIVAPAGARLIGGDFSNIEGRVNAWLAREEWKLEAFRLFDRGLGPDLYKVAYAKSFGVVDYVTIGKAQRQIGKVQELAFGYQGGIGAALKFVNDIDAVADAVLSANPMVDWERWEKQYLPARDKFGLGLREWVAFKIMIKGWRMSNANIVQGWYDIGDAAIAAVENPGKVFECYHGSVKYLSDGDWLYCGLPDGSALVYASPHVRVVTQTLVNKDGEEYDVQRKTVFFYGWNSTFQRWEVDSLYGGKQCENIVSGTARMILARAMLRADSAGYPLILSVHDEIVAECPYGFGSVKEFEQIMAHKEEWMTDLPLAVSAFEDERYSK